MILKKEEFDSIYQLMDTINKRPNNPIMRDAEISQKIGDEHWYGTQTYGEAVKLMQSGYTKILPEIKEGLKKNAKIVSKQFSQVDLRRATLRTVGFVPCVPNAILNLPNSMIDIKFSPQKRKTLHIIYIMAGNAGTDAKTWVKAGIALLTAIKIIERRGISTRIDVSFFCAKEREEVAMGSVTVKKFGQPIDLQKLCFPLACPAMFRRIGFKFLETTPLITESGFSYGYGMGYDGFSEELSKMLETDRKFILSGQWIRNHDYEVTKILEKLNFK